ncbi:hypothetical protein QNI16_18805 [Cytophagaceae bacterium YF14B1]|uniref:Uncharacterized protein n=1 Tax=Xanthocytophaga flava TaxID=3048013 RepID=A0AAE3QSR8_9BACT|nr:hypothetical protein [Xanthocytophaga flavus]MDJ1482561.1 hypothetical protein [Xanthocytophaga flavus]
MNKPAAASYRQPMTKEEIQLLQEMAYIAPAKILLLAGFYGFFFWLAFQVHFTALLLLVGLVLLSLAYIVYTQFFPNNLLRQDIKNGQKIVVQGEIEEKSETGRSDSYTLTILNHAFAVSEEDWQSFRKGQMVEIHFAPLSKHLFEVKPIN